MGTMERYERFKAGEDVDKLMEEAASFEAARNVNPKTQGISPVAKKKTVVEKSEESAAEA
jgi:hypothetical protein